MTPVSAENQKVKSKKKAQEKCKAKRSYLTYTLDEYHADGSYECVHVDAAVEIDDSDLFGGPADDQLAAGSTETAEVADPGSIPDVPCPGNGVEDVESRLSTLISAKTATTHWLGGSVR